MARARTLLCFPPMPQRLRFVCSTIKGSVNSTASNYPNTPTRSGMATWRTFGLAPSMDIESTGPMSLNKATVSIPTNCC